MKKVVILHGTSGSSKENWFPWLKSELEQKGYDVWVPDLPGADQPNIQRYNKFILDNKPWEFDEDTIIVGHSSGAVAILGLLQHLPEGTTVGKCYLVGAFKDDLGWDSLSEFFTEPFDFALIKQKASSFTFIHSDNDPYCPLDHAQYLSDKVGGTLYIRQGQGHFSTTTNPEYTQFPYLRHLIIRSY